MEGKVERASTRISRAGMTDGPLYRRATDTIRTRVKYGDQSGFTLVELVVVVAIISILFMIAVPRITRVFSTQRENFAVLTGIIVKTFDDAFLNDNTNYLILYLKDSDIAEAPGQQDDASRNNGVSVQNIVDGVFKDHRLKSLRYRGFSDDFVIEGVVMPSGEKISSGNVLIPFYPQGYADNVIIHILVNGDQQWSVRIDKHIKEPKVIEGYAGYGEEPI